ncbi:uncharacterized protein LOC110419738 [Herrania umbratica]|uniref:Uncharacterized protein LOC110419738 n=1 Tax=Herrania umbratica TaxID=108875 RepID=A0A6J1AMS0_9ROSI|nr:uncharacterized protein LOC110419738 [Herrania umbratica]
MCATLQMRIKESFECKIGRTDPSITSVVPAKCSIRQICTHMYFFLFISFSAATVSSAENVVEVSSESEPEVSYSDYCSSVVPESIANSKTYSDSFGPFDEHNTGYYIGGNRILDPKITRISNLLSFETRYVHQTNADDVSKIKGSLTLYRPYHLRSPFILKLHGFWSESSGKLCMRV